LRRSGAGESGRQCSIAGGGWAAAGRWGEGGRGRRRANGLLPPLAAICSDAMALARVAPEPQLGPMTAAGFADQLAQASALHDNHLSLDHSVYGPVSKNPGEIVALIKTTKDLEAKGNEVDWTRSNTLALYAWQCRPRSEKQHHEIGSI
jgi:hypothetical protein